MQVTTTNGETVQASIALANGQSKLGRQMSIRYNSRNPEDARKDSLIGRGTMPSIFLTLIDLVFLKGAHRRIDQCTEQLDGT